MIKYYRLTVKTAEGVKRFWCRRISKRTFRAVDKGGSWLDHYIIADLQDIISLQPAIMNLKYAELELGKGANKKCRDEIKLAVIKTPWNHTYDALER